MGGEVGEIIGMCGDYFLCLVCRRKVFQEKVTWNLHEGRVSDFDITSHEMKHMATYIFLTHLLTC